MSMTPLDKEQMSEIVPQRHRNAQGAWITGQEYKEQSKATQTEANSDHGDFTKRSVDPKNA
jgi:hypothetical protein